MRRLQVGYLIASVLRQDLSGKISELRVRYILAPYTVILGEGLADP